MAKARNSYALWRGSTKSKTYSTLKVNNKEGRVQIIKDRVYEVANPQTDSQMLQRVIFATVSKAAEKMAALIEISQEGNNDRTASRQAFIQQNIAFLRSVAGRRVGLNRHYLAAYAPKGNTQLIPNSYMVSKGSLSVPSWFIPKTDGDNGTFGASSYADVGHVGTLPFGTYTVAQLWEAIFGLKPGDQVTFPQIYGDGEAQVLLDGDYDGAGIVDKTLLTSFCAPRIVLLSEMPEQTLTIDGEITAAQIQATLSLGIDNDKSWEPIVDKLLMYTNVDEAIDDVIIMMVDSPYDNIFGANNDDTMRAVGCILSRQIDSKWLYSTSQLVCVWDFIGVDSGNKYFGFTLTNAMDTYRPTAQTDAEGNFLQSGGQPDIVPESFQ